MENHTKKAMQIINNSHFVIKNVKTLNGREGYIVNANLYYKSKLVAYILDDGNGGCLNIDWNIKQDKDGMPYLPQNIKDAQSDMETLVNKLPKKSMWGKYDFDDEGVINALIDQYLAKQDFMKALKKVSVVTSDNKIASYKAKASDLNKMFNFKDGIMTFRDFVLRDKSVKLILNDIALKDGICDAFDVYLQYR